MACVFIVGKDRVTSIRGAPVASTVSENIGDVTIDPAAVETVTVSDCDPTDNVTSLNVNGDAPVPVASEVPAAFSSVHVYVRALPDAVHATVNLPFDVCVADVILAKATRLLFMKYVKFCPVPPTMPVLVYRVPETLTSPETSRVYAGFRVRTPTLLFTTDITE
jgi:hypothetical protein